MKRQSKAEEALNNQLRSITAQCDAMHNEIGRNQVKLMTLDSVRMDLEREIDRLKGIRLKAPGRAKQ